MNNPTIKNLKRGLVAIHHGNNQAKIAVEQLNCLLSIVWPNDIRVVKASGVYKYYFKSKIQTQGWDCGNGCSGPSFPVSAFLEEAVQFLGTHKARAIQDYAIAKRELILTTRECTKTLPHITIEQVDMLAKANYDLSIAIELLRSATLAYNKAVDILDAAIEARPRRFVNQMSTSNKKAAEEVLNTLTASTSVDEFCAKLDQLKTILKQNS